jgi:hypothetical protein
MDPYLEARRLWKGVHDSLVYRMLEELQPRLQPRYLAVLEGKAGWSSSCRIRLRTGDASELAGQTSLFRSSRGSALDRLPQR